MRPALLSLILALASLGANAAPANKCVVNGTVTYQQGLCPTGQTRKQPTLEELNAEEKRRRAERAAARPTATDPAAVTAPAAPSTAATPAAAGGARAAPGGLGVFSCDGRTHCSQMTSCAEAKYFLANCPGVKMDGDRDGIPCEEQWCTH